MNAYLTFSVLLALPAVCFAQVSDPHVLASSGSEGMNTDLKMEWTMGQMALGQGGNNHYHLTQGFHQPMRPANTVDVPELDRVMNALLVWPNPVSDELNVQLRTASAERTEVAIYDERGSAIMHRLLSAKQQHTTLSTGTLASGNYIVVVRTTSGAVHGMARFTKVQ